MTRPYLTQPISQSRHLMTTCLGRLWRGHSCLPHRHSCRCPALAPFFPPEVQ